MPDFGKLIACLKLHYGAPKLPPAIGPVSYTHLDVYKRQVLRSADEQYQLPGGNPAASFLR